MFDKLTKWVIDNGGYVDKDLYVSESGEIVGDSPDRTLKIKNHKGKDTRLFKIPKVCTITSDNTDRYSFMREICIKLIKEMSLKQKSFYYPYLCSLPSIDQIQTIPYLKLNKSNIFKKTFSETHIVRKYVNTLNNNMLDIMKDLDDMDIDDEQKERLAEYSIGLYKSRTWNKYGFVPLADLMNHINNSIFATTITNKSTSYISYDTCVSMDTGCEVAYCYNINTPIRIYLDYGIMPNQIKKNSINMNIFYNQNTAKFKNKYLTKFGYPITDKYYILFYDDGYITHDDLQLMRILMMDIDDEISIKGKSDKFVKGIITMNNEIKILQFLLKFLNNCKIQFSIIDDMDDITADLIEVIQYQNSICDKNIQSIINHWLQV